MTNIWQNNGYSCREDYLNELREEYGAEKVNLCLTFSPPEEDFDGLVVTLKDMENVYEL
tara:strand:- start:1053 stop:1229 length:177 start_codon:yes stop_codon:yes gene_type:complete